MTERNLGETISWWVGTVVDVMDPHEAGRLKVRIFSRHDDEVNIPDSALPWALVVQPATSAAIGKIGTAPVGAVKGTKVVGLWTDKDHQYPVILGTIGKSGDPIPGEFENGAPKIDWSYGSIPSPSQASTPHPFNPYAQVGSTQPRYRISDIDAGRQSIASIRNNEGIRVTHAVQQGMRHQSTPSIGFANPRDRRDVLDISRSVNPSSIGSIFPCLLLNMLSLKDLLAFTTSLVSAAASVIRNIIVAAIQNAILNLAQKLGVFKVLQAINEVAGQIQQIQDLFNALNIQLCGVNLINQGLFDVGNLAFSQALNGLNSITGFVLGGVQTAMQVSSQVAANLFDNIVTRPAIAALTPDSPKPISLLVVSAPPSDYVRRYYDGVVQQNPFPGYITYVDPISGAAVYVRSQTPDYVSVSQHMQFAIEDYFTSAISASLLSGRFNPSVLVQALIGTTGFAQNFAAAAYLGQNVQSLARGISPVLAGLVGAALFVNISQNIRPALRGTVLQGSLVEKALDNFAQGQALLASRLREIRVGIGQRAAQVVS
jgi:hypothetical protein